MQHVLSPLVVSAVVVSVSLTSAQQDDQATQLPTFRAGVDVVSLNVTVTDRESRFITGLTQEDFAVYETASSRRSPSSAAPSCPSRSRC